MTIYNIPFSFPKLPEGYVASVTPKSNENGVMTVTVRITTPTPSLPETIRLRFTLPNKNMAFAWEPIASQRRKTLSFTPNWLPYICDSRLSGGAPVLTLVGHDEKNGVTVYLRDCKTAVQIKAGLVEETAEALFTVDFFSQRTGVVSAYETNLVIDTRPLPFPDVLRDVEDYWVRENGYTPCHTPDDAFLPIYSTWYSYHQAVETEALVRECEEAAKMGMRSIIVDDGWQTDDNARGYAYCGDWRITKNKIPDIHDFVDRVHALGMKVIFWYSVPFLGVHTESFERFKDMLLTMNSHGWGTLDPRYAEVRAFLIEKYVEAVRDWDLDGLKLDFIDDFRLHDDSKLCDDAMDIPDLFDAVHTLMSEIRNTLQAIKPGVLLEFRQSYIGSAMQTYGNMFRVGDCPNDTLTNRASACDMRMMMHKVAVHSDMLMWHKTERVEDAARQLLNVFFTVPQISVRLGDIPESHKKMLAHYLKVWCDHRDCLVRGSFTPEGASHTYTRVTVENDAEAFILLYGKNACRVSDKPTSIINASEDTRLYIEVDRDRPFTLYDCMGNELLVGKLLRGTNALPFPPSAMMTL